MKKSLFYLVLGASPVVAQLPDAPSVWGAIDLLGLGNRKSNYSKPSRGDSRRNSGTLYMSLKYSDLPDAWRNPANRVRPVGARFTASLAPVPWGGVSSYAYNFGPYGGNSIHVPGGFTLGTATIDFERHGFTGSGYIDYVDPNPDGLGYITAIRYNWDLRPPAAQDDCGCVTSSCPSDSTLSPGGISGSSSNNSNVPRVSSGPNFNVNLGNSLAGEAFSLPIRFDSLQVPEQQETNQPQGSSFLYKSINARAEITNPSAETTRLTLVDSDFVTDIVRQTNASGTETTGQQIIVRNGLGGAIIRNIVLQESTLTNGDPSIEITETIDGAVETVVYSQPDPNTWVMLTDGGNRRETLEVNIFYVTVLDDQGNPVLDDQGNPITEPSQRILRRIIEEKNAADAFIKISDIQTTQIPLGSEYWQDQEIIEDPEGKALTTTYTYYPYVTEIPDEVTAPSDDFFIDELIDSGKLETISRPNGSLTKYSYYKNPVFGQAGNSLSDYRHVKKTTEFFAGVPDTKVTLEYSELIGQIPGVKITTINDVEVARRTRSAVYTSSGYTETTREYSDSTNYTETELSYYKRIQEGNVPFTFDVYRKRADGTISATRDYSEGDIRYRKVYEGVPSTVVGEIITSGTITITGFNEFNQEICKEVIDVEGSVEHVTEHWYAANTDSLGRPTLITYFPVADPHASNNDPPGIYSTSRDYGCCGVSKEVDRYGVATYYAYDEQRRLIKSNRLGVTTETVYNGLTTSTHRYVETVPAGGLPTTSLATAANELTRTVRNLVGDVISEWSRSAKDGALVETTTVTTYSSETGANLPAGIGKRIVTTLPQTAAETTAPSQTTDYYIDGQMYETSGDLQPHMRYSYSATAEGLQSSRSYVDGGTLKETVTTQRDKAGRQIHMIYTGDADGNGQPDQTSYAYNNLGQQTSMTDADGVVTFYQYDTRGRRTTNAVDVNDNAVFDLTDDQVARTVSTVAERDIDNDGTGDIVVFRTTTSVWKDDNSATAQVVQIDDQSVDGLTTWSTQYPDETNPLVTNPLVTKTEIDLGTLGDGNWTVKTTLPNDTYTIATYTAGLMEKNESFTSDDTSLFSITYGYDTQNRLLTSTDSRTTSVTRGYVSAVTDVVETLTDGTSRITTNSYDVRGRLLTVDAPDSLDSEGLALTNVTTTSYFPHGQVKEVTGAQTYRRTYTYDYAHRMETLTTYGTETAVTRWEYNANRGWLDKKRYNSPAAGQGDGPSYTYTAAGRLKTRTWARQVNSAAVVTTYSYDDAGRLDLTDYSDATTDVDILTRDRLGRVLTMTDAAGTHTYNYEDRDALDSISYAGGLLDGANLDYSTDDLNRPSRLLVRNSGAAIHDTNYGYDSSGRLSAVAGNGLQADYRYHAQKQQIQQLSISRNGAAVLYNTREHDTLGRLQDTAWHNGANDAANFRAYSRYQYQYNDIDQRINATLLDKTKWTYGYNSRGEVIKASQATAAGTLLAGRQFDYGFDGIGNRTSSNGKTYTPNALNQYATIATTGTTFVTGQAPAASSVAINGLSADRIDSYFYKELTVDNSAGPVQLDIDVENDGQTQSGQRIIPPASVTPVYDLDGNLTNDGVWEYAWDAENRLTSIQRTASAVTYGLAYKRVDYFYDGQSRRIERREYDAPAGAVQKTTKYIYDQWNCVAELQTEHLNLQTVTKSHTWGTDLSGSLQGAGGVSGLLWTRNLQTQRNQLYCYDGNGNVTALVDPLTAEQTAHYEYSPFGQLLRETGPQAKENEYKFSTKPQDQVTAFYYYGYRWYDSENGRWLNRDPIEEEGGDNLYGFIYNDSSNQIDILGLELSNLEARISGGLSKSENQKTFGALYPVNEDSVFDAFSELNRHHGTSEGQSILGPILGKVDVESMFPFGGGEWYAAGFKWFASVDWCISSETDQVVWTSKLGKFHMYLILRNGDIETVKGKTRWGQGEQLYKWDDYRNDGPSGRYVSKLNKNPGDTVKAYAFDLPRFGFKAKHIKKYKGLVIKGSWQISAKDEESEVGPVNINVDVTFDFDANSVISNNSSIK